MHCYLLQTSISIPSHFGFFFQIATWIQCRRYPFFLGICRREVSKLNKVELYILNNLRRWTMLGHYVLDYFWFTTVVTIYYSEFLRKEVNSNYTGCFFFGFGLILIYNIGQGPIYMWYSSSLRAADTHNFTLKSYF